MRKVSNKQNTVWAAGVLLGLEKQLSSNLLGQLGVSYYTSNNLQIQGDINQFADPIFNNLTYKYNINTQRVMLETKLLTTIRTIYHPYVTAGLGEAINKAYGYNEMPVSSDAVPMVPGFNDRRQHLIAGIAGLGLDVDITPNLRLGGMYRYLALNKAGLGTSPLQDGNQTLINSPLQGNEFLLQLSYLR